MYVEVSIPIALFKTFTYIVPQKLSKQIFLGQSVFIPFNKKIINGFIVEVKSKNKYKGKILEINDINNNSFIIADELWKTLSWISKYYICPIGTVLNKTIAYQHKQDYRIPLIQNIKITQKGRDALEFINYKVQKKILLELNKVTNSINIKELNLAVKFAGEERPAAIPVSEEPIRVEKRLGVLAMQINQFHAGCAFINMNF